MPKYGLIACFSWVINYNAGESKFGQYGSAKVGSWKMEKKIVVSAFQTVAKTCYYWKNSSVAGDIDYVRYISMQKVKWDLL